MSVMRRLACSCIRVYQLAVSPYHLPCCRFEPSCSQYALEAFTRLGFFRAAALTARRLLRCHPLGGHGYDPVPDEHPVSGGAARCGTKCTPTLFTSTDGNTHYHGKQTRHAGRGPLPGGAPGLELPVSDPESPPEAPGAQPG